MAETFLGVLAFEIIYLITNESKPLFEGLPPSTGCYSTVDDVPNFPVRGGATMGNIQYLPRLATLSHVRRSISNPSTAAPHFEHTRIEADCISRVTHTYRGAGSVGYGFFNAGGRGFQNSIK